MTQSLNTVILIAAFLFTSGAFARDNSLQDKSESLHYLQDLRNRESKRLREINETLSQKMDEQPTESLDQEMFSLKTQQKEHQLRQEFLDRLIFQIDTKFGGGDLRAFLERVLIDMAKVDAVSSAQSENGLWKFLKYSADAIRRLPEQKENILAFLEGYMNRSVANPVPPQDYLAARNYTNGVVSDSGRPLTREDAGSVADRRLQEMNGSQSGSTVPTRQ
jgi:hypothetical protein